MVAAIVIMTLLGASLGVILGIANRLLRVETNPLVDELTTLLPGSNCGQCGFAGCAGAAAAMADGSALPTICPPGGRALAKVISIRLGVTINPADLPDDGPQIAAVSEELCIGCCRCIKVCPTDAILGAAKQIHNVLREACTGCGNCIEKCPTEALLMMPVPVTLQHWVMPKPLSA